MIKKIISSTSINKSDKKRKKRIVSKIFALTDAMSKARSKKIPETA